MEKISFQFYNSTVWHLCPCLGNNKKPWPIIHAHGNSKWLAFLEWTSLDGTSSSFLIEPWYFHMLFPQYPSPHTSPPFSARETIFSPKFWKVGGNLTSFSHGYLGLTMFHARASKIRNVHLYHAPKDINKLHKKTCI